jgi:hypothetical protein
MRAYACNDLCYRKYETVADGERSMRLCHGFVFAGGFLFIGVRVVKLFVLPARHERPGI